MYFQQLGDPLKLGLSSPAFAYEPFLPTLDNVAKSFELWEIVADLRQLLPDIIDEFKEHSPSYNLDFSVHAPFNDLNLASLNPKLRVQAINYVKESIRLASDLEIPLLSFHPGHLCPTGVYYVDKVKEANLSSIHEIAEFGEEYPITIALENMPLKFWTLGNTADEILEMIKDTELGICFDIGHAFIQNEVDNFLNHIDLIRNIHIHDNSGRRDEHLILGEGEIDIPKIISTLTTSYSGNLIIESNNLDEGIKSKEYLINLMKTN
jgi:sugar phosphate isomerase/epimerase